MAPDQKSTTACKRRKGQKAKMTGTAEMINRRRSLDQWLKLQRERALTLLELRKLNECLEDLRPFLRDPPLDGYSIKFGGTDETPGISGLWLEHYLDCALTEEIISEDELQSA
jgi:hypothetical protein